ncbi:hypothetical protein [Dictyobacter arantiisoli]|uniref:Uncharacterized protein n=1 Tax=Dictyobacter arantiisoli TaxID=2014874 RepID=A0A5A5TEN9_9CHLR|nr:hypothetical protein [Dictyobacter arantiisoli]GCF09797.1 hypothetical protein KDI_33610 [Dictyobacter arantiisoli]
MAQQSIGETRLARSSTSHTLSLYTVVKVRFISALIISLSSLICFLGTSWDIQWHAFVGRDRTLIPPHEMMLSGIGLSGIAALLLVVTETIWARQNRSSTKQVTPFAGLFSAPLGAYIAGYAALNSAVAFPLDTYWHSLYGIDVTLWAPFHVMIISGMALTGLGAAYLFASAANLASRIHAPGSKRTAYAGMVVAFATTLSLFMLLVFNGLQPDYTINLGFISLSLFPCLIGLLVGCILIAAASLLPWQWAATSVFGVSALFVIIDQLAIPPALTLLMQLEQLTFLKEQHATPPQISIVSVSWPLLTIVAAVLIDLVIQRAKKQNWSKRQLLTGLVVATFLCTIPVTVRSPLAVLNLISILGVAGVILSFALGFLGTFMGVQLGQGIGKTMRTLEG